MDDGMETGGAGSGTNADRQRRENPNELLEVVSFPGPLGLVWACWLEDLSFLVDPARLVLLVISSCLEDQRIDVVIVAVAFAAVVFAVVVFAAVAS